MVTEPEVFIIESLTESDLQSGRLEGRIIKNILEMGYKNPAYHYVETREQFSNVLEAFKNSRYRYLHISSHGNNTHFRFQFGLMSFMEFDSITSELLFDRRIFISACEIVNENLARRLIPSSNCYSLIGPYEPIRFDDAAIIWSSYYYLTLKNLRDGIKMDRRLVLRTLRQLTQLYQINLNYFSRSREHGMKLTQFLKGKKFDVKPKEDQNGNLN